MEEITLTGGTLAPSSSSVGSASLATSGGTTGIKEIIHSHNHSHPGSRPCCQQHQKGIEMMAMPNNQQCNIDELAKEKTDEEIGHALSTLIRFGRFEAFPPLLDKLEEHDRSIHGIVLAQFDQGGHTLLHWAAKRVDDIRFLQTLINLATKHGMASKLNVTSNDNVGMHPIHWACTEGSIIHTALLLKNGADPEAKDNSGCTPLLIAAQYGQVEVVAYLLKQNANIRATDTSHDTALHWAAYKGSIEIVGLLTYYNQLSFATQDTYGQTPLHLAALRGHTSVVRYILQQLDRSTNKSERGVLFVKDKNERTPLDLAIHKNRPNVEVVLKEAMTKVENPGGHFIRNTLWHNLKEVVSPRSWKVWMGLSPRGVDETDTPTKFPFYFVVANLIMHFILMVTFIAPFFNSGIGLLWDKSGWLMLNFLLIFLVWYSFVKTVKTSPGYLDESLPDIGKWRKLYDETLDAYADENFNKDQEMPFQLCHTCHVARPHRSKHCRVSRKCILLFDHFCPFVDNTVGLYNYKYFYMFLLTMVLAEIAWFVALIMYTSRYKSAHGSVHWLVLCLGIEICIIFFPVAGLLIYHTQLCFANLSTNEHMNLRKYKYLYPMINNKRQYRNPWDKGYVGNFMDRMNPSTACYEIREDKLYESLISSSSCCENGRCENV